MIRNKQQIKGISLISLIITVVILLIIASISINTLFNNNIVQYTQATRKESTISNAKEIVDLVSTNAIIEGHLSGNAKEVLRNSLFLLK